jgi:hypothetical protein
VTLAALEALYLATGPGAAPIRSGDSKITYLVSRDYLDALLLAIDYTSSSDDAIYLFGWAFEHDFQTGLGPGPDLKERLTTKALAGVDVRVIIWANPNLIDFARLVSYAASEVPSVAGAGPIFAALVADNLNTASALRSFVPVDAPAGTQPPLSDRVLVDYSGSIMGSHHMKGAFILSSNEAAGFGSGIDLLNSRWSDRWHDAGFKVTGPAALDVLSTFQFRWTETALLLDREYSLGGVTQRFNTAPVAAPLLNPREELVAPTNSSISVQIARSLPAKKIGRIFGADSEWHLPQLRDGLTEIKRTLLKALAVASTYIYIEDQSFDAGNTVFPLLVQAADRGVKVIMVWLGESDPIEGARPVPPIIPPEVQSDVIDTVAAANRDNIVFLQVAGVTVHSKITIIDDEFCLVGSANCIDRSLEWTFWGTDSELSAAVVDDGDGIQRFRTQLWSKHLDVDPADAAVATAMTDLRNKALGVFRPAWATGPLGFTTPTSKLRVLN